MVPISEEVSRLASVAKKLNAATESHNKLIEKLEGDLRKSEIGVACWADVFVAEGPIHTYIDGEDGPALSQQESWDVGFQKLNDVWGLVAKKEICSWPVANPQNREWTDVGDPVPLLKAPRAVRVEAAPYLEQLVRNVREKAEKYLADIDSVAAAFGE